MTFEADAVVQTPADVLSTLAYWVQRIRQQQDAVARLEKELELTKSELNRLVLVDVPDAMQEVGLTEIKLTDGAVLAVKRDLKVNISEVNRAAAFAWLDEHGHGMAIRSEMTVDLRAMEAAEVESIADVLRHDFEAEPVITQTIHNATLKSIVSGELEKGTTVPSCISVHDFKKATIKEPKQK